MSEISTSLTINFTAPELDEPFELVADDDDQGGSAPVQVAFSQLTSTVCGWGRICYGMTQITPLAVTEPGRKRVKLYCSGRVAATARLIMTSAVPGGRPSGCSSSSPNWQSCQLVDGGTARLIGRRSEPVVEALTWTREHAKRLRWFHDSPAVEVIERTPFRDAAGNLVDAPRYDRSRGEFHSPKAVIGALVVRYDAGFSLYEITYGNGRETASAAQFAEMQSAWQSGNVETAEIPPVRVIALSEWHATQASFERKFWPVGAPSITFRTRTSSGNDSQNDADEDEEDAADGFYQEVPGTRQTVQERIYHPEDPEQYLDVEKTLYLEASNTVSGRVLKLRLLNHANS